LCRGPRSRRQACKIGRFILFGATIGAITALAYAARHPERVSHLVMVGGFSVARMARKPTREPIEETELEPKAIELLSVEGRPQAIVWARDAGFGRDASGTLS